MPGLTELIIPAIGLLSALLGVGGAVFGLWKFWIKTLYDQLEEERRRNKILEQKADPAIALERDKLRGDVEAERVRRDEIANELKEAREESAKGRVSLARLRERYNALGEQDRENVSRVKKNADLARKFRALADQQETTITDLQAQLGRARTELTAQLDGLSQAKDADWSAKVREVEDRLRQQLEDLTAAKNKLTFELGQHIQDGEDQLLKIQALDGQVADFRARDDLILSGKGRIWERPVPEGAAPFVPLARRRMPIISILNLKGGVGKTTLTANLAALFAMQEKNTLVIDLDYQRSLTKLCCPPEAIKELHQGRRCIQHFFLAAEPTAAGLELCSHRVRRKDGGQKLFKIVACSEPEEHEEAGETLDDTEMHLFARWLLEPTAPDARFHLRKALHAPATSKNYRYVLLDCPPRLSLACVNALAASDFVLVPVLLDETSAGSVPLLLKKLRRLRTVPGLMPELGILGIVANQVRYDKGTSPLEHSRVVWGELGAACEEAYQATVHRFPTLICQSAYFGKAAYDQDFVVCGINSLRTLFTNLVSEIEQRIGHEHLDPPAVLADSH